MLYWYKKVQLLTPVCPLRELELTHERTREPVAYIHKRGGTILGSSREYEAFSD